MKPREIPYRQDAEQTVLGSLLVAGELVDEMRDQLKANDFYLPRHQLMYSVMLDLRNDDKDVNFVTVAEELERQGEDSDREYILELHDQSAITNDFKAVSDMAVYIVEAKAKRDHIALGQMLQDEGYDLSVLPDQTDAKVTAILEGLAEAKPQQSMPKRIKEHAREALKEIERRHASGEEMHGLPTGLTELDKLTGGFKGKQNIVVAGRSGHGKTAWLLHLIDAMVHSEKFAGKWFYLGSFEMEGQELCERYFSSLGKIDSSKIRSGRLDREDFTKLTHAFRRMEGMEVFIDDEKNSSIYDVANRIKRLAKKYGPPAGMAIDYLQLLKTIPNMSGLDSLNESSWMMKVLASKYNCPLIDLAQVRKDVDTRTNKRPNGGHDIVGSGNIYQDADIVIFLYNDSKYHPDSDQKGILELIVNKHRGGECKNIIASFIENEQRITDFKTDYAYV